MTIWTPHLDRGKPLYLAIADAMARDVAAGALAEGSRLPPQRDLAWRLGVTHGTVTRAYKEAELRGLMAGEVGRGSYIRATGHAAPMPLSTHEREGLIDLTHAIPPPVITAEEFDAAMMAVMRDPRRLDLLDYAPPDGFPHHRAMGVNWLKQCGIETSEASVVVTAGAHIGLITVLESVCEANDVVMAEAVNYGLLRATFRNARLEPLALAMDEGGLMPDALERAAKEGRSRVLYIVPSLQNPTTTTLSRNRRDAIVAIARRYDLTIIEDDIFRLLDARTQPPTFYALAPERTFHVTSLSKALAPGLRIGFVVTPIDQERVQRGHIRNTAARTVGITGEIARHWIETGMAAAILDRSRGELASRRTAFIEIFKGTRFRCEPGAPFAWLELPEHWSATGFVAALAQEGIRIMPGAAFQLVPSGPSRHVRVCFGHPGQETGTRRAFETIRALMNERDEEDFTPVA